MDRVIDLIVDGVGTIGGQRDSIVYNDLGQVQVWVDSCHLFQAVIKTITVVDVALIVEWLRYTELYHSVSFGLLH